MNKPKNTQYEEIMEALEKVDQFIEENGVTEFEDTGNPDKPFRTEYAHEALTQKHTRYRRNPIDV